MNGSWCPKAGWQRPLVSVHVTERTPAFEIHISAPHVRIGKAAALTHESNRCGAKSCKLAGGLWCRATRCLRNVACGMPPTSICRISREWPEARAAAGYGRQSRWVRPRTPIPPRWITNSPKRDTRSGSPARGRGRPGLRQRNERSTYEIQTARVRNLWLVERHWTTALEAGQE